MHSTSHAFHRILAELPATWRLSAPMVAGLLGQMLMSWADNLMIGRLGVTPLAACSFANNVLIVFLVFGFGVMSSVPVLASQAFGAGRNREVGEVLWAGSLLALVSSIALAAVAIALYPLTPLLGQPPEVLSEATVYYIFIAASFVPTLTFAAGKAFSESVLRPWLPFWVTLASVLLNVFLNWVFIYGNLGAPRWELAGAGLATLLSRLASHVALCTLLVALPAYRPYLPPLASLLRLPFLRHIPALIRIGLPSGFQVIAEVGAFSLAGIMVGWLGAEALAAHQIALTCAGTSFMIPLGLSHALTVRMGQLLGSQRLDALRPVALGGLATSLSIMFLSALCFLLFGRTIATWFVQSEPVIALAATLLLIVGIFQLFDGTQIVAVGALRGLGDVRAPMLITYLVYWAIGLPISALLAFPFATGAPGIWTGLAAGLGCAALLLARRLWRKTAPSQT